MARLIYVGKRLIQLIPVLFGVTILAFLIIHLIPGDPATIMLGPRATPSAVHQLTAQMGLDKPLWVQYGIFLKNLLMGQMGDSVILSASVNSLIGERLGTTFFLVVYASLLSLCISVPIAMWSALRKNSLVDNGLRTLMIIGISMPQFWVGILLMLLLSIKLKIFPVSGYGSDFFAHLYHLFLPSLTVAVSLAAVLTRPLRTKIIAILSSDFVEAARSRGLSGSRVLIRHVLRNALVGTVTILGVNVGWLLGGSVVIETVFSIPGLGQLLISSILARDYPVIQGLTLVFAILVMLVNLVTDLVYTVLDPRVELK